MPKRIYVRDDLGYPWFFEDGRIRNLIEDSLPDDQNGYPCINLEEGIKLLNEMGYITEEWNE